MPEWTTLLTYLAVLTGFMFFPGPRRNPAIRRWQVKVVGRIYGAPGLRLALPER